VHELVTIDTDFIDARFNSETYTDVLFDCLITFPLVSMRNFLSTLLTMNHFSALQWLLKLCL